MSAQAFFDDYLEGARDFSGQAEAQLAPLLSAQATATQLQEVTGTAISPGLVLLAYGSWRYIWSEDRNQLPWHSSLEFLIALGVILILFCVKDLIPFEPLQKLLASLENLVNSLWGVLGLILVAPPMTRALEPVAEAALTGLGDLFLAAPAIAAEISSVGAPPSMAAYILAAIASVLVYAVIWLVSNTVNMLCLIAPGFCAPILKSFRTLVAGSVVALTAIHPLIGIAACLIIFLISLILFRWSLRLTVWGALFSFDLIFRRWRKPMSGQNGLEAFACGEAKKLLRLPKRTRGRLNVGQGGLFFSYRRFLFFRKTIPVFGPAIQPGNLLIGRRLFAPVLAFSRPKGGYGELFAFRLRHKTREDALRAALGLSAVQTLGLRSAASRSWTWLKSIFTRQEPVLEVVSTQGQQAFATNIS